MASIAVARSDVLCRELFPTLSCLSPLPQCSCIRVVVALHNPNMPRRKGSTQKAATEATVVVDSPLQEVNLYELERQERIRNNQLRLAALGVKDAAIAIKPERSNISTAAKSNGANKRPRNATEPARRSLRHLGVKPELPAGLEHLARSVNYQSNHGLNLLVCRLEY